MTRKVSVRTSTGNKVYKISESSGGFFCSKFVDSFFNSWDSIGQARRLEDAISLIKSHATQYGSVYGVDIY